MCGMGRDNQAAAAYLIQRGADIEAEDTYGFTPLLRMASNNLAMGAEALLRAGADPQNTGSSDITPMQMALESRAQDVIRILGQDWARPRRSAVVVNASGVEGVNQRYIERDPTVIPVGFSLTCAEMQWDSEGMWTKLSNQQTPWYEAANGSYIYWNMGDGQWWIDAPDGKGVYVAKASGTIPPAEGWHRLAGARAPVPTLSFDPPSDACGA